MHNIPGAEAGRWEKTMLPEHAFRGLLNWFVSDFRGIGRRLILICGACSIWSRLRICDQHGISAIFTFCCFLPRCKLQGCSAIRACCFLYFHGRSLSLITIFLVPFLFPGGIFLFVKHCPRGRNRNTLQLVDPLLFLFFYFMVFSGCIFFDPIYRFFLQ